ncbi:MAG: class A beta-lactamase-related serine hydrolase [Acidobacteriota bacterium]|nr:class A beta-lactamase-related serine hydrolase [Acidobacteriota bacterium]
MRVRSAAAILMWMCAGGGAAQSTAAVQGSAPVGSGAAGSGAARSAVEDARLVERLRQIAGEHHGRVALFASRLGTGRVVELDADAVVQTASVIKLAVLYEAMEQVRSGKAHWADPVRLGAGDGVAGSGILRLFDTPQTLTLRDVLGLMVMMSDNTATNLAIDRLGLERINERVAGLGLKSTYLYKKIGRPAEGPMPADQARYGLGKTTPREMAALMERIGRCELDRAAAPTRSPEDEAICAVALTMLRNQFYKDTIPRYLEKLDRTEAGSGTASKTGSLNAVRNDVAIVAGISGPMVLSIFTYENKDTGWTADNEGELTIARLAKAIVDAWSPGGIDGKALVPGLGLAPGASPIAVAGAGSSN